MNNFFNVPFGLGLGLAVAATATFAASHSDKNNDKAVAARHAQMQLISYSTGVLGAMAKGEAEFDAELAESAAVNLNAMAKLNRASAWIAGTEQGVVDGSRAKPEVWKNADAFAEKFAALEKASAAMIGVGDLEAVKAGMKEVGGACKACHDDYRGPKN